MAIQKIIDDSIKKEYLVRPGDFSIFESGEDGKFYIDYGEKIPNHMPNGYLKSLLQDLGFEQITKEQIPEYQIAHKFYMAWRSWASRNDGHGEAKGGMPEEFVKTHPQHLEDYKTFSKCLINSEKR